jgi:hypothetical protein
MIGYWCANLHTVRAGAEVALSRYGQSISHPDALNGALFLDSGRMSVDTTRSRPGGIIKSAYVEFLGLHQGRSAVATPARSPGRSSTP